MGKNTRVASIQINNKDYSIRATGHAMQRISQRNVDISIVVGDILAIGKDNIKSLSNVEDYMLIDEKNEVSIVFTREKNTILIVTVLNKSNVFIKQGTKTIKL